LSPFYKNLALWLVISLMVILLFNMFNRPQEGRVETTYSQFLTSVDKGDVAQVTIQGSRIFGKQVDGRTFQTFMPRDTDVIKKLTEKGVEIQAKPEEETPWYMSILISWFPMLLLIGIWIFFMRQMQVGGGKAMSFGKSRARLLSESSRKVTFQDVAGIDEAKEELQEIVEFLKDPKKFTRLGGRIPKGVLLVGAPGTGKTLLARAIAGEAGVPFFSISGSDFVEMFVGVGASRVRDLFLQGKKSAPCIIFIDEIDAVGRHRGAGLGGGHDEREQTLNQLLVEMDGFESNEGVILISATNRPDVLDPALLRPGRFDRQVVVPVPDIRGREGILKVHLQNKPLAADVNALQLAKGTPGFTGADLENLVNEAALLAARHDKNSIDMADFEEAKDKVMMGLERKSMILSEEDKRNTAYHEAGHALVARLLPGTDPVHKVTIIPRGRALGLTQQLPQDDRHTYSRDFLVNSICILMGGRVAEELIFQARTTGASNDIERATQLARRMVCEWGMSDTMGPLTFGKREEQIFLGREIAQHRDYSEQTAITIDHEVRRIIEENYQRAYQLLNDNVEILHAMAQALLEKETIDIKDINQILGALKPELIPASEDAARPEPAETFDTAPADTRSSDDGDKGLTGTEEFPAGPSVDSSEAQSNESLIVDQGKDPEKQQS
jgi:cell division protease FtsH